MMLILIMPEHRVRIVKERFQKKLNSNQGDLCSPSSSGHMESSRANKTGIVGVFLLKLLPRTQNYLQMLL